MTPDETSAAGNRALVEGCRPDGPAGIQQRRTIKMEAWFPEIRHEIITLRRGGEVVSSFKVGGGTYRGHKFALFEPDDTPYWTACPRPPLGEGFYNRMTATPPTMP
jgi:hypothetical protein